MTATPGPAVLLGLAEQHEARAIDLAKAAAYPMSDLAHREPQACSRCLEHFAIAFALRAIAAKETKVMSKRKNRLLREEEAQRRLLSSPDYVAGARLSGVPDAVERIERAIAKGEG